MKKNEDQVIASLCFCNNGSINIHRIDEENGQVIFSINNTAPIKRKLYFNSKGVFFNFGSRFYLHEFLRM
jgi:hypothetical protein